MAGFNSQPTRRRWLMPAVILLVGGAIAWWASSREAQRVHAVEARVKAICATLAEGRDLQGTINPENPAVERAVAEALRRAVGGRDHAELIQVRVVSGDPLGTRVGSSMNAATHTAILHIDGLDLLALRVRCESPDQPVEMLGFVTPPAEN